ncbi:2'-5' RNA ligase family protein [Propioniciclava flava]|uniref:2'-5' RNA ligase family protein n=1 Tax=Propioniciclava flava TaxID=2072026 RepID=A0A4Q2EHI5_9ACTN|nr:2'-5' RNA ligase family protein [Propioniciclava flava]RXW33030.1 hypothetical protein C1706_04000 [Propioniciclava flava]
MGGHAVLLIGVPALEGWIRERTAFYDASFLSADPRFAHAHITILAPCPPDLTLLTRVAATVAPFDFTLRRCGQFPDGTIHLIPEPADGFTALTAAARAAAPHIRPYWGRAEPAPHLTLDRTGPGVSVASTLSSLADVVPARGRAEELLLTWWESDRCRVLGAAPLGDGTN